MERDNAIEFLLACKPLLDRVAAESKKVELTEEDHKALNGFYRVWVSGRLCDSKIYQATGLNHRTVRLLFSLYKDTTVNIL